MKIIKNETDSLVFGKNFLEIKEFSCDEDFIQFEKDYITNYTPYYVATKIPIENLKEIHFLEKMGFNFIETQIKETLRIKNLYSPMAFYPYKIE